MKNIFVKKISRLDDKKRLLLLIIEEYKQYDNYDLVKDLLENIKVQIENINTLDSFNNIVFNLKDSYQEIEANYKRSIDKFELISYKQAEREIDIDEHLKFKKIEKFYKEIYDELEELAYTSKNDSLYTQTEIEILTNKLKSLENGSNKLDSIRLEKEKLSKELESLNILFAEQKEIENKLKLENQELKERQYKINNAIERLKVPAIELKQSKIYNKSRRDLYTTYAENLFKISGALFGLFVVFIYVRYLFIDDFSNIKFGFYFFAIFPVIFTTALGFLFIRQSNINSNEIKEIDKRFILIHEVNQSLIALTEVNKDMNGKTERVIDKLINNILDYASGTNSSNSDKKELDLLQLNEKVDKIIDTLDKKKTVFNILDK